MPYAGEEATKTMSAIAAEEITSFLQYYNVVGKLARSVMHLGRHLERSTGFSSKKTASGQTNQQTNQPAIISVTFLKEKPNNIKKRHVICSPKKKPNKNVHNSHKSSQSFPD